MNKLVTSFSVLMFSLAVFSDSKQPTATRGAGLTGTVISSSRTPASNTENRIKLIIAENLRVLLPDITLRQRLRADLGADDLDLENIILDIEREFRIYLPVGAAENIITVQDAVDYIKDHTERN